MPRQYTIKAGDTLERIAMRECGSRRFMDEIIRVNKIANPSRIFVGQVLTLTCGDAPAADTPQTPPKPAEATSGAAPAAGTPPTSEGTGSSAPPGSGAVSTIAVPGKRPGDTMLAVPYYSQEDPTAAYAAADCGPTCLRMLIGWHRARKGIAEPTNLTVDDVTKTVGIRGGQFSVPGQLVRAGAKYDLPLIETTKATLAAVIREIDAGRPVISLVQYGSLSKRMNQRFKGGHFVVVVGYNAREVILNDPDWWGSRRNEGMGFRVPRSEFETATGRILASRGNFPNWAVFVDPQALA